MSQRLLIAGPWVGEFGWELFAFQARVRALAPNYEKVIVLGIGDKSALYADFAQYHALPLPAGSGDADGTFRTHMDEAGETRLRQWCQQQRQLLADQLRQADHGFQISFHAPETGPRFPWIPTYPPDQIFRPLTPLASPPKQPLVLLVTRERQLAPERNAPADWWVQLTARLQDRGYAVERFAGNLTSGLEQLARADLAIGASTGGLHLASLAECPHYVWGPGPAEKLWNVGPWRVSSAFIYLSTWNPFGTPVFYEECGWSPAVEQVADGVAQFLQRLGRRHSQQAAVMAWRRDYWQPARRRLRVGTLALRIKERFSHRLGTRLLHWTAPFPQPTT